MRSLRPNVAVEVGRGRRGQDKAIEAEHGWDKAVEAVLRPLRPLRSLGPNVAVEAERGRGGRDKVVEAGIRPLRPKRGQRDQTRLLRPG
jgi:hypothetical protein